MKLALKITGILIGLLSIAAGFAKASLVPEEADFLSGLGLSETMIISFGILQILGGILFIIPKTLRYGGCVVALGFIASAILILMTGNLLFFVISCLPAALAGWIAFNSFKQQSTIESPKP
jgi:hypothetical protein